MRYSIPTFLIFLLLWLAGCASSEPGRGPSSSEKRTFKTRIVKTNFNLGINDLASPQTIRYQVRAQCKGNDCKPVLYFFLDSGPNTVFFNDRSVSLQADDEQFYWKGRHWQNIRNSPPVNGLITSIMLKRHELQKIAEAKKVKGTLAGNSFDWSHKNRAPMRAIWEDIDSLSAENR